MSCTPWGIPHTALFSFQIWLLLHSHPPILIILLQVAVLCAGFAMETWCLALVFHGMLTYLPSYMVMFLQDNPIDFIDISVDSVILWTVLTMLDMNTFRLCAYSSRPCGQYQAHLLFETAYPICSFKYPSGDWKWASCPSPVGRRPGYTMQQLAERLSLSRKPIASRLKKLKEKGDIEKVGSDCRGEWKVNR